MHRAGETITDGRRRVAGPYGDVIHNWPYAHKCLAFCKFSEEFGQCPSPSWIFPRLLCLCNARAFPLLPAALASVSFGFVLNRVRVQPYAARKRTSDVFAIEGLILSYSSSSRCGAPYFGAASTARACSRTAMKCKAACLSVYTFKLTSYVSFCLWVV